MKNLFKTISLLSSNNLSEDSFENAPRYNYGNFSAYLSPDNTIKGATRDYLSLIGDPAQTYVVGAALNFVYRKLHEVDLIIERRNERFLWELYPIKGLHYNVLKLFDTPNAYTTGKALFYGVTRDVMVEGNAYLLKRYTNTRELIGFIYLPSEHVTIETRLIQGKTYLFYRYSQPGEERVYSSKDIVHFKWGTSETDPLMGVPMIKSALREIANDVALNYVSTNKANNGGNPDVILSPEETGVTKGKRFDLEQIKLLVQLWKATSREGAGLPYVSPVALKMQTKGFTPMEMQLTQQRNDLASKIAAPMGFDVMVFGLPSENKTYSNYKEAIENAVENSLLPLLNLITDTLTSSLHSDLSMPEGLDWRIRFDIRELRGLQEDIDKKHERVRLNFRSNLISLGTAQQELNYEVDEENRDKYFSELFAMGKETTEGETDQDIEKSKEDKTKSEKKFNKEEAESGNRNG